MSFCSGKKWLVIRYNYAICYYASSAKETTYKKSQFTEIAFPNIHQLVEHNECDQLITVQLKTDQQLFHIVDKIRMHPA